MPTLHWVGKDKVVNHHHDVPFRVLNKVSTFAAPEGLPKNTTDNRIIHGDNLEALKSLLPEFEGQVKCIYIDPPYNTGNEGWVYNDAVNDPKMKRWLGQVVGKEGEDLSRHDKWLCMMYPRLKLLHRLLSDDGVIFISIDDNEVHNLRAIMNEIFGPGNFVVNMIWQKMDSPSSNFGERAFSNYHDHTLVFAKRLSACKLKQLPKPEILKDYPEVADDGRRCRTRQLRKNGKEARREDRETMWYPMEAPDGSEVWPRHPEEGWDGRWAIGKKAYEKLKNADKVVWKMRDHGWVPYQVEWAPNEPSIPNPSILTDAGQNRQAKALLNDMLGTDHGFDTPKPVGLVERILRIASDPNSIVVDSFAGSGTTGHAVLKLNAEDGGRRRFILIETEGYAETITARRVRTAINGYGLGENIVDGLGGGFDYYTVGEPMFLPDDNLNEAVGTEAIRGYVAYSEGISAADRAPAENPHSPYLLGLNRETAWVFHYEPDRATSLDMDFLGTLRFGGKTGASKPGTVIIYADRCLLSKDFMAKHGIIFKKIPRDITRF
ncbi:MAG: type III restriction endonuclease subunit M [Hydrogenophilales bacterium 17-64-11]|nr:MAG: type III restriction endonuclease subunit M [Hydrogenophilales bacterium 17-64-11]